MSEELKIIISAEIGKLKENVSKAKEEIKKFATGGKESVAQLNEGFQKAGEVSKKALAIMGGAIVGATTALLALTGSTQEYRNEQAKLTTAFETAGADAETAKETYNDLFRVLGDSGQATEAASHLAKLTTEEEALAEWTEICQGVYATFGDSLAIEGLTEAVNHTAKLGEVQGSLADALEWSGVNVDAFNEQLAACNTEAEREALIRETLNADYATAAANYEVNNAAILAQNEAQSKMNDAMAALGEAMQPVLTALTQIGAEILEKLQPVIQDFVDNHLDGLKSMLTEVAEAIGAVINWVIDNWELVSTIALVIAGISAAFTVLSTVMGIVNAVMAASPVTWIIMGIVAAIAAIVAIIVVCIKHWEDIKETAIKVWEKIKDTWDTVADWFSDLFTKAWEGIKKVWSVVVDWFKGIWDGIVKVFSVVIDFYAGIYKGAWEAIKKAWSAVVSWFTGIWNSIKNVFSVVGSWFGNIFTTAWNGIKNAFSGVKSFFSGIWNSIKSIFSNVGATIGNAVTNTVKTAINGVLSTATKIINGFISAINIAISVINAIPGVSIKKLNKLTVPKLAKGGIIDSATLAVVGERGKEAVMPLENNLEWLDKLAGMLNDRMGGSNQPIILKVGEKTFGEIAVSSINNLTRQTGKLNLVMA